MIIFAQVYASLLLVWLVLRSLFFDRFWWLALLNTSALFLYVPLLLAIPAILLGSKGRQRWGWLAVLLIPGAIALHWYAPYFLPRFSASPPSTSIPLRQPLKVMSFNVLWDNTNYDQLAQSIRQANPDVIGFQELRPDHLPELKKRLGKVYPYSAVHPEPDFHTVGVLSRFPLEAVETLPNPSLERGLTMRLLLPHLPQQKRAHPDLLLLVTHLAPNNMFNFAPKEWIPLSRQRYAQRLDQVRQIQRVVETAQQQTTQATVLMLCDCNMTDTSETYHELERVLSDSFREVGWGLGHTIPADQGIPLQRIDYVWHSRDIEAIAAEVGDDGGSDHFPLVVTLVVTLAVETSASPH